MTTVTIAEEIVLLAYQDDGSMHADPEGLGYAAAGAVLAELTLAGRLNVVDDRVEVADATATGEPLLDEALTAIGGAEPAPAKDWVERFSGDLPHRAIERLVERGLLRRERDKVLFVFPRTRFPSATGGEPAPEAQTRRRADAVLDGAGEADPRSAAVLSLLRAARLVGVAFPGRDEAATDRRIAEAVEQSWPDEAVRRTVKEVAAAVDAVLLYTTTHHMLFTDNN